MGFVPYAVVYLCLIVFTVAVIGRFFKWSRMPMHVRWELYPVAHEGKKAHYGGSYLEESKWWQKKREVSLVGELKVMVPEILFLVALREHNQKLWTWSFPFHFGLYLVGLTTVLMMVSGVLARFLPALPEWIGLVTPVTGAAGLCLGVIGAFGLFVRRRGREMRDYTAPADYFNLLFFVVAFGIAGVAFVLDPTFGVVSAFVANLVTFSFAPIGAGGLVTKMTLLSALLLGLLTAYIPLTHMSHFVGKYFAYHSIRWNDKPNLKGGDEEETIHKLLNQPITWAAPHIKGDGKKTWLDAATEELKK